MIYICIPVFNRLSFTVKCIESIHSQSFKDYKIVICDDGSSDGTKETIIREYPDVVLLEGDGNLWWSGATNLCVEYVLSVCKKDDFIFTLNNDTEISKDCLIILYNFALNHPQSIVSTGNYFENDPNKLESTAFVQRKKWPFSLYQKPLFKWGQDVRQLNTKVFEVNAVSGKGVLIPVQVFKNIGLYNAAKLPQYHGDSEFARRANENGYRIYINLNAIIYTNQLASGIGQVNSKVSLGEFLLSFVSLRSENYIPSLYYRSKIIYKGKWPVYLLFNLISIVLRFLARVVKLVVKNKDHNII